MKLHTPSIFLGAILVSLLALVTGFTKPQPIDCLTQEQEDVLALLSVVTMPDCVEGPGYITLRITGANFQVVNGLDETASINGLGNIIVGYAEPNGDLCDNSGSHNLIVGPNNAYSSYAGLVTGIGNQILGIGNVAHGTANIISDNYSSILGGLYNEISEHASVIVGGAGNTISGEESVILGGEFNDISGDYDSIVGGYGNVNSGDHAVISGGYVRSVIGTYDWAAGTLFEDL